MTVIRQQLIACYQLDKTEVFNKYGKLEFRGSKFPHGTRSLSLSPNFKLQAYWEGTGPQRLRVKDTSSGEILTCFEYPKPPRDLIRMESPVWRADSAMLYFPVGGRILECSLITKAVTVIANGINLDISPDGTTAAILDDAGVIKLVNLATRVTIKVLGERAYWEYAGPRMGEPSFSPGAKSH